MNSIKSASNGQFLHNGRNKKSSLQIFWKQISRNKYLFIIALLLSLTGAYLVNTYTTPVYIIKSALLIKDAGAGDPGINKLLLSEGGASEDEMGSIVTQEIALLNSYPFIYKTISALDLGVSYFEKETVGQNEIYSNSPFKVSIRDTSAIDNIIGKEFAVSFLSKDSFSLKATDQDKEQLVNVRQTVFINRCPININVTSYFNDEAHVGKTFHFAINDLNALTWEYKDNLEILTDAAEGSILGIEFSTTNPAKGIAFLNEYTKQYIKDKYEEKSRAASQVLSFINEQINSVKGTLGSTESSLANVKSSTTFSDANDMMSRNQSILSDIENQRSELMLNERYYATLLDDLTSSNDLDQLTTPSSVGVQDGLTEGLIRQLADLQMEKSSYAANGNSKNPLIQELDVKINNVRGTLKQNIRSLANSNRMRLNQLGARAGQYQARVSNIPFAERRVTDIKRAADFNDNLYQFLMQKRVEAGILKASATVENKVIEPPYKSGVPLEPKKGRNYVIAFVIGLLVPYGFVQLRSSLNKKLTGKEEIQETTSIPIIGTIYRNPDTNPFVISSGARTAVSESFRILRSNLTHLAKDASKKVFLITSTNSGEGKSFTAINTATSFALAKKKTILINLDLRVPSDSYNILGHNDFGITSFLEGNVPVKSIVQKTSAPLLDFISTGELPVNPAELLMEGKLEYLFEYVREHYDYVIIDSPPLGIVADPLILANYSDLNILIVREKYTLKESLFELEQMHNEGKIKDVVMVINDVRLDKKGYKNAYYYKK
jgi:capsular exopolysaccharide synthesis family protein